MEKGVLPQHNEPSTARSPAIIRILSWLGIASGLYLLLGSWESEFDGPACRSGAQSNAAPFDWDKLQPSKKLHWVPLDHHDHSVGTAAIALIRYPAKVDPKSEKYRGPILFNPGGPGGPGVGLVLNRGPLLQAVVGDEFDIIGFDPRVDIFPLPLEREKFALRYSDAPLMNETSGALGEAVALARLTHQLIYAKAPLAAQLTEWVRILLIEFAGAESQKISCNIGASLMVQSSATHGVVDAEDYYSGTWGSNLREADKGLDLIFRQCAEAENDCPLYESTPEKVKSRYFKLLENLEKNPVPVFTEQDGGIVNRRDVHALVFVLLYSPYTAGNIVFEALRQLEAGNGHLVWRLTRELELDCQCGLPRPLPTGGREALAAIACTDAHRVEPDHATLQKHYEELAKVSIFADIWANVHYSCIDRQVKPKWEWKGPVAANHTSFPILMIGNTLDPVTPDANKMSKAFNGSVALTQNSAGHCSIAASSLCTAKAIRKYFQEGVLPEEGTVCDVEDHVFLGLRGRGFVATDEEEARILSAIRSLRGDVDFAALARRRGRPF
ncbi:hypothetical protein PIIN_07626 [Serendipita indica DSM 11827]|uniref:Peptidase S33 tripeptidyl aminopeptidase-like C-terminal domain-containing protein n=1 Tax=Serendipita indica (strain DSM 11827) TaxID=1109443 RepID=G4TQT2_SERID|nr:hypothetical protein PIIN_07626 [Serendipita indica DSM 11827]